MKSDVTAFLSRAGAVGKEMQNYGADIRNHFETLFTHRRMTVYESLPESRSFVDVTVLEPTEEEPFYFLYTSGMSRMSMASYPGSGGEESSLAELYLMIPAKEEMRTVGGLRPWPVRLLAELGAFPHMYGMWFSYGFYLPLARDCEYTSTQGTFSGALMIQFDGELGTVPTADGHRVQLFMPFPVYAEEAELYGSVGPDELTERILRYNGGTFLIDLKRPNAGLERHVGDLRK